jgi:hypothetical protein
VHVEDARPGCERRVDRPGSAQVDGNRRPRSVHVGRQHEDPFAGKSQMHDAALGR